jgi:F420-0:gamma-glutamyl ligase-like protein
MMTQVRADLAALVVWAKQLVAEHDGTVSSKRVTYVGAFVVTTACLVFSLIKFGHTALWNDAFTIYCGTWVVGYVGGKLADRGSPGTTGAPPPEATSGQ